MIDTRVMIICLMFSKITRTTLKKAAIFWKMASKMADIVA